MGVPAGIPAGGTLVAGLDLVLPEFGPIVPERPSFGLASRLGAAPALSLSYADQRVKRAAQAVTDFAGIGGTDDLVAALNRRYAAAAAVRAPDAQGYIAVATFADQPAAEAMAAALGGVGRAVIDTDWRGDGFALSLHPDGEHGLDDMLRAAWAAGAADAMPVRE
jgi:rare lipoprotein A